MFFGPDSGPFFVVNLQSANPKESGRRFWSRKDAYNIFVKKVYFEQ